MLGRDLIIYIMQNHLEDEVVLKGGIFIGYINEEEVAAKFEVGVDTIRAWHKLGWLKGINVDGTLYFLSNIVDPRKLAE